MSSVLQVYTTALTGGYGLAGCYGVGLRLFGAFALLAGPLVCIIDAPFGRNVPSRFSIPVNGNLGWLLMELVSPLSLLYSISLSSTLPFYTPIKSTKLFPSPLSAISLLQQSFSYLPRARSLLILLYLAHYLNRSVISTLRNPGRAKMGLLVPLAALIFNGLNGSLQGVYLAGGFTKETGIKPTTSWTAGWGIQPGREILFGVGVTLFILGLAGNIISDEHLYALKRSQKPSSSKDPRDRYSIPQGWLFSWPFGGISYPSYTCEWIEWTGYVLATQALSPAPFPALAVTAATSSTWTLLFSSAPLRKVPKELWPWTEWWLQAPALFLWNEISVMLPRAMSGHRWYRRTFGDQFPKDRKVVIPGSF